MEDIFKQASRQQIRFVTDKGHLSVEDLWNLPITNVATLGLALKKKIQEEEGDDDFVQVTAKKSTTTLKLQLALVKDVYDTRQAEKAEKEKKAEEKALREQELAALVDLEVKDRMKSLESLTPEARAQRIKELQNS
jgi:hypothetical protein